MFAQVVINSPAPSSVFTFIFNLFFLGLMLWLAYLLVRTGGVLARDRKALKLMRQSTALGQKVFWWLEDHYLDLDKDSVTTLYHPELVNIIEEDQKVYDKICSLDSNYAKVVTSPKDLYQKLIDLATSKNSKP